MRGSIGVLGGEVLGGLRARRSSKRVVNGLYPPLEAVEAADDESEEKDALL